MMDAQLVGTGLGTPATSNFPVMDLYVPTAVTGQHIVPIITGDQENAQQAQVLCIQVINSIPQLPGIGVDWMGFLAGTKGIGQLDASIRANLAAGGHSDYSPNYDIQPSGNGDRLTVTAVQQEVST
jgi:hypothetical protein